jgi:hypothetical protein
MVRAHCFACLAAHKNVACCEVLRLQYSQGVSLRSDWAASQITTSGFTHNLKLVLLPPFSIAYLRNTPEILGWDKRWLQKSLLHLARCKIPSFLIGVDVTLQHHV